MTKVYMHFMKTSPLLCSFLLTCFFSNIYAPLYAGDNTYSVASSTRQKKGRGKAKEAPQKLSVEEAIALIRKTGDCDPLYLEQVSAWYKEYNTRKAAGDTSASLKDHPYLVTLLCTKIKKTELLCPLVKALIREGADVNAPDESGKTPLMETANRNYYDVALILIKHGADIDARNERGSTALMFASSANSFEVAALLLDNGADIYAKDEWGTAVEGAKSERMKKFLRERGVK